MKAIAITQAAADGINIPFLRDIDLPDPQAQGHDLLVEELLLERFGAGAKAFAPALADTLATRASDPYNAARELIVKTIRKEYSNDLA